MKLAVASSTELAKKLSDYLMKEVFYILVRDSIARKTTFDSIALSYW